MLNHNGRIWAAIHAMKHFVDKVDKGLARSTESYKAFRFAIDGLEPTMLEVDRDSVRAHILTSQGHKFDFMHPKANTIDIEDIAHALSHICRFNGHTKKFYSVAQHSVMVSKIVPPKYALAGLLHDAYEAYGGDVTTPLKRLLPGYKDIEHAHENHIWEQFGLAAELPPEVKYADEIALLVEMRDLMPHKYGIRFDRVSGLARIECLPPAYAKELFLNRFKEIYHGA